MKIKALKGFKDIVPGEVELWQYLEEKARRVFERFNFAEIRLPLLEETQLFARSIGEATDIVEKEMYTFVDKQVTLRPEATASLIRAYIEHGLYVQKPVQRLFTIGPMFRHERPQKGRLRQFHQMDVEVLGSQSPRVDSELIAMASLLFTELGINVSLELNSLGCPACRPKYRETLVAYVNERKDALCSDCQRRSETNPLRVLDCKVQACKEQIVDAPSILEHLCDDCSEHFNTVQDGLNQLGVKYTLNKFMVRGLDYYCRTTFEFITADLGAQAAVAAGGRYDGLIETLGGPKDSHGIGFAMGMERLVLLLEQQKTVVEPSGVDLFIAGIGEEGARLAYGLAHGLRAQGISIGMDHEGRSLKAQMKLANKDFAKFALIIGDSELESGVGVVKNMRDRDAGPQEVKLTVEAIAATIG
ncbi:MAG: histidine--tRNA ligase [Desulfotalea sp.]|nr:MAG: histidine--tRNA ligase [Desulfotalea sp.]